MRRADRCGRQEVEDEVAIGDGVDRVRRHRGEAELAREEPAVGTEVHAGQRARPERKIVRSTRARTRSAARRAGTSRNRPAGGATGKPAARAAGACTPAWASRDDGRPAARATLWSRCSDSIVCSACARVNIAMSVATWSLRERAVCSLPPTGADDLGQPALDGHVDVLVGVRERELALFELALDAVETVQQRVAVGVADDAGGGQHRRVRARLLDVVGTQPPVEADRRVELLEDGILRLREARHRTFMMAAWTVIVRPAPARGRGGRAALRIGQAVLRRLRRHRGPGAAPAQPRLRPPSPLGELRVLPRRRGRGRGRRRARRLPLAPRRGAGAAVHRPHAAADPAVALAGPVPPPARRRARRPASAGRLVVRGRARGPARLAPPRRRARTARARPSTRPSATARPASRSTPASPTPPRARSTRRYGFTRGASRRAPDDRIAEAIGGPGFVSYFKGRPRRTGGK